MFTDKGIYLKILYMSSIFTKSFLILLKAVKAARGGKYVHRELIGTVTDKKGKIRNKWKYFYNQGTLQQELAAWKADFERKQAKQKRNLFATPADIKGVEQHKEKVVTTSMSLPKEQPKQTSVAKISNIKKETIDRAIDSISYALSSLKSVANDREKENESRILQNVVNRIKNEFDVSKYTGSAVSKIQQSSLQYMIDKADKALEVAQLAQPSVKKETPQIKIEHLDTPRPVIDISKVYTDSNGRTFRVIDVNENHVREFKNGKFQVSGKAPRTIYIKKENGERVTLDQNEFDRMQEQPTSSQSEPVQAVSFDEHLSSQNLTPKQLEVSKQVYNTVKDLPESELRLRLDRLSKLPVSNGIAGITAINYVLGLSRSEAMLGNQNAKKDVVAEQKNNFETMPESDILERVKELGKKRNLENGSRAMAQNADALKYLEGRKPGDPINMKIMQAYNEGFQSVNDKNAKQILDNDKERIEKVQAEETKTLTEKIQAIEKQGKIDRIVHKIEEKQEKRSIKKQDQINRTVRDLLASKKDNEFTHEDKIILAQYEGDGGQTTNNDSDAKGKGLLYEFYTPQQMIDKTWDIISGYIKPGANVLEPSAGIGKWAKNIQGIKFDMLEIDPTSSRIAKILNPESDVKNMPFEKMFLDNMNRSVKEYKGKKYSAAVGYPPYGTRTGTYKASEGKGFTRYENYFMSRSLDTLEEGGILAMVVPSGFLSKDSSNPEKKRIMDKCELVDAYRFPEGAFSNTKIGTDLVILRKNTTGTQDNEHAYGGRFFEANPDKVLGEKKERKNRFGKLESYIEGDVSKFLEIQPPTPKEMSQAQKDAISKGLMGNDNAKGSRGATKKENANKEIVRKQTEKNKVVNEAIRNTVSSPVETYDQNSFNAQYQTQFDEVDSRMVSQTNTLGFITDFAGIPTDFNKIAYVDGKYVPHYIYKSGNIKERLAQLEKDKDDLISKHGQEAYDLQKRTLENSIPKTIPLENITLSPIDSFSASFAFKNLETQENYVDSILGKSIPDDGVIKIKSWNRRTNRYDISESPLKIRRYGDNLAYALEGKDVRVYRRKADGSWEALQTMTSILNAKKAIALLSKENWNFDDWEQAAGLKQEAIKIVTAVNKNEYSNLNIPEEQKKRFTMTPEEIAYTEEEGTGDSLMKKFYDYIENIDSDYWGQYNQIGRLDVKAYCDKQPVTGKDAEKNATRRKERREAGEKLFKKFINEELSETEKQQLESGWNDYFNNKVEIDPKIVPIKVEGLSKTFKGKEYKIKGVQTQFISKFIQKGVGCAAHQVGVGKTMSGIIATVSNMQMGKCKKPVVVVPTSVLQKWEYEFRQLYPNVPLNIIGTKQLNDKLNNEGKFQVADGSVTVMSYDAFERFGFSGEKFDQLTAKLKDQIQNPDVDTSTKAGKRKGAQEDEKAGAVAGKAIIGTDERLQFDKAGFDHITVDEAHNFNNIFTDAATTNASGRGEANEFAGITGGNASARGMKLWLASRHVLQENNNRNILLLTATPFTNNPLQVYSLISLMAKERLEEMGIYNIREFIAAFVETGSEFTMEANGQVKERTTVRSFKNAEAFRKLVREFFDYRTGEEAGIKRPKLKQKSVLLPPTQEMVIKRQQLEKLFDEKDENGRPAPGAALKSIGNQQIMNISPALVKSTSMKGGTDPDYGKSFVERSPKVQFALDSIAKFYKEHKRLKPEMQVPGQLCFLPRGVEFTSDMKNYLIKKHGIPADAIGVMTPKEKSAKARDPLKAANGISQFTEMTDDFNNINGKLKIVIGSDVIKEGVDLNGNTAIAYNLMTAWNPTDEQQKLGRAWRQGNNQDTIHFVNIQIEDSIDTKLFQKQAEKASRINDIFADDGSGQSAIDVSDINPDDIKLDVITDPTRKAQVAIRQEEAKAEAIRKEKKTKIISMQSTLEEYVDLNKTIKNCDETIEEYLADIKKAESEPDYEPSQYDYERRQISANRKEKAAAKQKLETTVAKKMELYQIPTDKDEATRIIERLSKKLDEETSQSQKSQKEKLDFLIKKYTKEKIENDKEKAKRGRIGLDNIVNAHVQEMLDSVLSQVQKAFMFYRKERILKKMTQLKNRNTDNRIGKVY